MALTNTTALTAAQVDYLNGKGAHASPFHGSNQVLALLLGDHIENLREDMLDPVVDTLKIAAGATLTIASGVITTTNGYHAVDTEAAAASDNLDNITATAASAGSLLLLKPASGARTVVIRHNQGSSYSNIYCPGGVSVSLADANDVALLAHNGSVWVLVWAGTLVGHEAYVRGALGASTGSTSFNSQSITGVNALGATSATIPTVSTQTLNESSAGAGISLTSGVEIIGVPTTVSTPIAFNTASGNLFAKPAGETWLIHSVWFKTGVDWDGNGAFIVGDATDADGFLVMANASLDPAYDETAGVVGWPPGTRGLLNSNEGVYLTVAGVPQSFISLPGGNIVLTNTPGTSTVGSGTLYMQYTRLP